MALVEVNPESAAEWMAYAEQWKDVECVVCHRMGFIGDVTVDFDSVGMYRDGEGLAATVKLHYAHRTCLCPCGCERVPWVCEQSRQGTHVA